MKALLCASLLEININLATPQETGGEETPPN